MKKELIRTLHSRFEQMVRLDTEHGTEFWLARDLQTLLGYARWENFAKVIEKAVTACATAGYSPDDHFLEITKMVDLGSGAQREIEDIALTRYACYLIAQNGDPSKDAIAFAQTYFAVQTRKQEIIEAQLAERERLSARKKLTRSEKELSGIIYERLGDSDSFARIRSKGDHALFGGMTTQDMKNRLNVPRGRALADFLPTITIKAKDFANEITNFNIKQNDLLSEPRITGEHVRNNQEVRRLLVGRGIVPERLPAAEDVKKVERRLQTEQKKLPGQVEPHPPKCESMAPSARGCGPRVPLLLRVTASECLSSRCLAPGVRSCRYG
ncbi:MAG: DNA damage-inducible protein D [Planctomycetota bacterium]|nr:DNA damage-inducible protein D [Planctomycetota bacterium]